jgi:pyruvate dehydrogenase E2 component (dihydrolipoamide acetyltransferase)
VSDFTLPELGENITAGDVLRVLVNVGDIVAADQPVLELETDKATIEVPSSVAGRVTAVQVKAGDKVTVGQTILSVSGEDAAASPAAPKDDVPKATASAPPEPSATLARTPEATEASQSEPSESEPAGPASAQTQPPAADARRDKVVDISRGSRPAGTPPPAAPAAPAAPSVRRLARELGVDVNEVSGSGAEGRISLEDVKAHAKGLIADAASPAASRTAVAAGVPVPDFAKWGEVELQPLRAIRRKTAAHLTAAWQTVPHVTQHDLADITSLESIRKQYAKVAEAAGGALTVTAVAVKVVASALRAFPQVNASIDLANETLILKKYVHVGIAVDTEHGLLVPVIRDADKKNIVQIAVELGQLSEKARARKLSMDEMQGGCFSISNLGGIGGTAFTPIVNAPELAILGISRARYEPVYDKETGQFVPRFMLPLSLSYDHRAIDGADGIRFLRWIVEAIEQPFMMLLKG